MLRNGGRLTKLFALGRSFHSVFHVLLGVPLPLWVGTGAVLLPCLSVSAHRTCGLCLNPLAPLRLRFPKRCDSRAVKMPKDKNLHAFSFSFKHLPHSHWIPGQAAASGLSQLSQETVLGSLRHSTKLPNTSLNHEKLLLLPLNHEKLLLLLLSVSGMSFPHSLSQTVWSEPLSAPPHLLEKGGIFYLKHSLDYASTQRHIHQLRWHFWWCCFDQDLCVSEDCSLMKLWITSKDGWSFNIGSVLV